MHRLWCPALAIGLLIANSGFGRADEAADLKKLLGKAAEALGGEAKIGKLKGVTQKGKGTIHLAQVKATFEETSYWQTPEKYRFDILLEVNGNKVTEQFVLSGAKGWIKINDQTQEMPKHLLTSFRDVFYTIGLAMRPMDAKGKEFKLSPLGELKVGDEDALGIQISTKGKPDVNMYLAKKTGLPLKCEVRTQDGLQENKEVLHEVFFTDYKKLGEVQTFSKLIWNRDGNKYVERELTEAKAEESLDDDLFGMP
jgi:hypothetical protein